MSYECSFAGAGFEVLVDGIKESAADDATAMHIPGGGVTVVDAAGPGPTTRRYNLFFASYADWSAFAALRNTTGTLSTPWGSWTALMTNPQITAMNPTLSAIDASADFLTV